MEPPATGAAAPAPYVIRAATPADAPALARLEQIAFDPATYGGMLMSERQFRAHAAGANILLVAEPTSGDDRGVCGYAIGFVKRGSPYVRFYSLAVLPEHGGRGAGWRLFAAMEAEAKARGYRGVRLEIRADNTRLEARYLRAGYREFVRVSDYYPDGMGAIRMVKDFETSDGTRTTIVK